MMVKIIFFSLICIIIIILYYNKSKHLERLTDSNNSVVKIISEVSPIDWSEPYNNVNLGPASGTGFFIDKNHIITNYHVIEHTSNIKIIHPINNSGVIIYGELLSIHPNLDISLLSPYTLDNGNKIPYENKHFLNLGDSDKLKKEEKTIAIGYPFGLEEVSHTTGIFSTFQDSVIQTTAPINPGNSGGPLLNSQGLVIGVNFAGIDQADNIGFAIPINHIKNHLDDLKKKNTVIRKSTFGASFTRTNKYYLQNKCDSGTTINDKIDNGPLNNLDIGDILCKLDENKIDNNGNISLEKLGFKTSLERYLIDKKTNSKLKLEYFSIKKNKLLTEDIVIQDDNIYNVKYFYKNFDKLDYEIVGGFIIMELTKDHLINFIFNLDITEKELKDSKKLIITSKIILDENTIDQEENLILPLIIDKINNKKVTTLKELRDSLKTPFKLNNEEYLYILTNNNTKYFEKMSIVNNNNSIIENDEYLRPNL